MAPTITSEASAPLAINYSLCRSSCNNTKDLPFEVFSNKLVDGNLEQRSTVDQWCEGFRALTAKYETPSAMCGYFAVANAILISQKLSRWDVSRADLARIFSTLESQTCVATEAERVMGFVQERRQVYIDSHSSDFHSSRDIANYRSDWVANYEISDYFLAEAKQGRLLESVHFFRYNQTPEFESATHEERTRLKEEFVFGGAILGSSDCKATAELDVGATRFFVERFSPDHAQLRPECWLRQCRQKDTAPPVFVVDVNDHFVMAVPLIVEPSPESQGGQTLLVVNTTRANYLHSPALLYLFDLVFGGGQDNWRPCKCVWPSS